jgi:hypothetical protein
VNSKRILITLPYSFSYRNIVLTGVLEGLLVEGHSIMLCLPRELQCSGVLIELQRKYSGKLCIKELVRPSSKSLANVFFLISSSLMYALQNTYSYRIKKESIKKDRLWEYIKSYSVGELLPFKRFFMGVSKYFLKALLKHKVVDRDISEFNPDVFLFTLSNKVNEYYYLGSALRRLVPTIGLVHSWDVITTKGSFLFQTDKVLVWNDINAREYEAFVNSFIGEPEELVKVGIPQFDIYKTEERLISVDEAREKIGLPIDKSIVLYTTSVPRLFPGEIDVLNRLISDFESGLFEGAFLYVRVHPQAISDYSSRFKELEGENYKLYLPEKSSSSVEDNVIFEENTLLNLFFDIYSSDVVVNMASSITLDAAAIGRKTINLSFDDVCGSNIFLHSVNRYYRTDHYSKILNFDDVDVAYSYEELVVQLSVAQPCLVKNSSLKKSYVYDYGNAVRNIVREVGR